MVSLTRCLVVRAIQTHRLFHSEAKATDLDNLSIIGLLAKIMHCNLANKIEAQPAVFLRKLCLVFSCILLVH